MMILEKPKRQYIPRHFVRENIAQAVHRAVCDVTGTDGSGHCVLYAVAGGALAKKVLGRDYVAQAGSLSLLADPPDGAITIDASDGGVDRGEFHVWLARPDPEPELVDFASRHFRHYVENMLTIEQAHGPLVVLSGEQHRLVWNRPDSDAYVWTDGSQVPYAKYVPDEAACERVWELILSDLALGRELYRAASKHFRTG